MPSKTNTSINGREYYRITRTIGHKLVDGEKKPIKKQFYGTSKGAAEKRYDDYLKEQARLKYEKETALDSATLHERAKYYIDNAMKPSARLASGTKRRYESSYNRHIKGTWIDDMVVKDIHALDLQRFYNELDVSMSTLKQVHRFMASFYKWMTKNDFAYDITSAVELPLKEQNKRKEDIVIWDDASWKKLTSSKFDFRHDFLIKLMCYSGMRISECLGLKYSDIRDDVIHVARQYTEGELKQPKAKSKRDIPMHPKLIAAYADHLKDRKAEMEKYDYRTDFVFTTQYGVLYDYSNISKAFNKFYDKQKIPRHTFHVYRATFCTKLCEAGVPIEVASKLLGHKSLEVTALHYALVRQDTKKDAIALLK